MTPLNKLEYHLRQRSFDELMLNFSSIMTHFSNHRCENPLDRIYGFLYIITKGDEDRQQRSIMPDYSKSTFDLAMELYDYMNSKDPKSSDFVPDKPRQIIKLLRLDSTHPRVRG